MADDLKRVGLKFTAEGAEDFKASLKSISSATKENYSELKLAQSQYDKNTSSTQKLSDKQKYLQKQTEAYSSKVEILQRQLDEEKNKEDASSDAIAKKETELNNAKAKLAGYQDSLEKVNKALETHSAQIQDFGGKLSDVGGKIEGVGSALSKGVTAPVAAAATASVAAWKEVDNAMDTVTKKTGASGAALEDMQNRAKSIAETIPVSFGEAGTAIGEVNTRFGLTGKSLQSLSTQFLEFAKLNGTDVNSSIDSVQKALSAFGLSADDAGAMLDTLNKVGQNTGISMDTLSSTMIANGAAFREMGFSASDAAVLIGNLEKSGINVNDVMTGLKKALAEASSSGESMSAVLTKAFSSAGDASDVFGSKAGPGLYNAMQSGILSMDMFTSGTTSLDDALGSVSDTFDQTLDPLDKTTMALNTLKDLGGQLVDTAAPMLTQALQGIINFLTQMKEGWEALPDGMQQGIVQFALVAAAIGPVVLGIGKLTSGIGGLITSFGNALAESGSFGGALTTLAGGPVGVIVAAIATVVVALVGLWNTSETFRNIVTTIWNDIQSVVGTVIDAIKGFWDRTLQPTFSAIGNFCQNTLWPIIQVVFMSIQEIVSTVFNVIKGVWDNILKPVFTAIGTVLKGTLGPTFTTIFNGIKAVVMAVFVGIQGLWNGVLKPVFSAIGNILKGTLGPVFNTVFNGIKAVVSTVFNTIRGLWDNVLHPVFNAVGNAVNTMRDAVSGPLNAIKDKFSSVFNGIRNYLQPVIDWLKGIFNFSWSLPRIRLPHFSVSGKFSLNPPSIPHFSVDWYAKAMQSGMILDSPTIFGMQGNTLLGAGEAGPEVVVGKDSLASMIKANSQGGVTTISYGDIYITVYGSEGQSVNELADEIERRFNEKIRRRGQVFK